MPILAIGQMLNCATTNISLDNVLAIRIIRWIHVKVAKKLFFCAFLVWNLTFWAFFKQFYRRTRMSRNKKTCWLSLWPGLSFIGQAHPSNGWLDESWAESLGSSVGSAVLSIYCYKAGNLSWPYIFIFFTSLFNGISLLSLSWLRQRSIFALRNNNFDVFYKNTLLSVKQH